MERICSLVLLLQERNASLTDNPHVSDIRLTPNLLFHRNGFGAQNGVFRSSRRLFSLRRLAVGVASGSYSQLWMACAWIRCMSVLQVLGIWILSSPCLRRGTASVIVAYTLHLSVIWAPFSMVGLNPVLIHCSPSPL